MELKPRVQVAMAGLIAAFLLAAWIGGLVNRGVYFCAGGHCSMGVANVTRSCDLPRGRRLPADFNRGRC